ncbi:MAG TPA: TRAP transporter small permease subunit [Burkholderiaceae bacterium]|jgi:TRAP-type transport system small permease protein|nr:TRAP transporter small permease subunit [Burkholderiaceae bacterium]
MLHLYGRTLERIGALERAFGVSLIFLIVGAITLQVFTRYALNRPIAWVEESATYAFIWSVFVGASLGLKQGRHIVIETFHFALGPRVAAALRLVIWLLVLTMLVVLVVQGFKVMGVEGRSKTISLPIEIPRMWFYSVPLTYAAASMAFTTVYLILLELQALGGRLRDPSASPLPGLR